MPIFQRLSPVYLYYQLEGLRLPNKGVSFLLLFEKKRNKLKLLNHLGQ